MLLLLLATGGMSQEAWAKVTYHILSLPISTKQLDGTDHQAGTLQNFRTNVRVEVLRCVSSTLTVGLPFEYKSPLVTTYHYYASDKITRSANSEQLYGYNNTQYYFYTINGSSANEDVPGNQLTAGDACADNIDIYVTYDYDPATSSIDLSTTMDEGTRLLSTSKVYNIHLKDRMVVLNQVRQNRPGAVLDGYYTPEQLSSNDFEWIAKEGLNNSTGYRHFAFKFGGNDPYNVTVFTAFDKNYTYRGTGQANFYTEFKKDRDKYTQKDVYKEYRGASFFSLMGAEITANMWLSSEANIQWQESGTANNAVGKTVPGYYKGPNDNKSTLYEMSPIFNSFAILNHKSGEGWALAGSKMNHGTQNWQPRASDGLIQYMDYKDNGNNIIIVYKAEASACKVDVYEVKEYVFRVQTPFGNNVDVVGKWSDYAADETITADMVPDALKRKYVNFTGSFYADAAHNTAVTTFADAQTSCSKDASDRPIIYVGYEVVGAPFTAITAANKTGGYTTATWYEMTDAASDGGKKIKWDTTNSVYKNNGASGTYEKESAFIGDPYELRIINRKLTADASANRYVGSSSRTTGTDLTNNASDAGAGFKWEIPYDETLGSFTLREFGSTDAYWQWNTDEGNTIQYSTSASTRIKVMEIGKVNYTFKVVDLAGNVAIQATAELTPFTSLTGTGVCYSLIPSAIRSPFLADETVKFYDSYTDRNSDSKTDRTDWHNPSEQTALTELPGTASDIYVAYTTSRLSSKSITLGESQSFNVKLNGEYIYWDNLTGKILSNADPGINPGTGKSYLEDNQYLWRLRGRDPYAMLIDNIGATVSAHGGFTESESVTIYDDNGTPSSESRYKGAWVKISDENLDGSKNLTFDPDRIDASRFIAMLGSYAGVYEVMAATGTTDLYHIGRETTAGAETKIYYSTSTYAHGADQLRFVLEGTQLIQYHLIDKSGKEIFRNEISSKNARLSLPQEYVSPLVATYHYYAASDVDQANGADDVANTDDDIFTLKSSPTDLSEAGSNTSIYVFYDVSSDFGFGTSHPYTLKFWNGSEYKMEDGADKLTDTEIQAVYPYCNGDGNLNIYGEKMRDEQMNGGSSTRPRWVWYLESENKDPYHVSIHSRSQISYNNANHSSYLQTYAVHFNQDADPDTRHIVTGVNYPGISGQAPTEYMVLGTTGRYKLVTTAKIAADLNGDGDTTDDGENERRTVTSFEQYWKTYNMIKQHLLGKDKSTDVFDENPETFVVPAEERVALKAKLEDLEIGGDNWHSYNVIANAVRWNGYNATGKQNSKLVENLEHWFQTFDMGNGEFDIEDANIPPVLVLLDRHGWEIMRKPVPMGDSNTDANASEKLAALRAYDSPMVKEYKFYSQATKANGCHKYALRMQDGAERDPIIVNGKHFTSTSLATLPPYVADRDLFVTYTVKEEYEKSYQYTLDYEEVKTGEKITDYIITSEVGTPSAFIVLQNHQYAWDDKSGTNIDVQTAPSSLSDEIIADHGKSEAAKTFKQECLWLLQPNLDIDNEMGCPFAGEVGNSNEPYTVKESKVKYKDKTGFDPYNLQLKNASTEKFFTTHMTDSELKGGAYTGVYSDDWNVTLADQSAGFVATSQSYDHTYLKITNQTFMAVQDENGNMQLMPRFDQIHRINALATLGNPLTNATKASVDDPSMGAQTTFFIRPLVFDYRIIDNDGQVAMRYRTGGEFYPSMPEHFKSPLAKDFTFYKTLTDSDNNGVYEMVTLADEITSSFAAADLNDETNDVFIRYHYDDTYDTDHDNILQGRWMTMKLNSLDVQSNGTSTIDASDGTGVLLYTGSKPTESSEPKLSASRTWHWKFLASPCVSTSEYYKAPDPYAVQMFNRAANYDTDPSANPNKMGTGIKVGTADRFVILSHPGGDYALAACSASYDSYSFLNGTGLTAPDVGSPQAATLTVEAGFTTTASTISSAAQLQFNNDIQHTYTYHVLNNDFHLAVSSKQDGDHARINGYYTVLPEDIQSPLLNLEDYLYYGTATVSAGTYTIDEKSQLDKLYGLYDDIIYVRYEYNWNKTPYSVPNVRNATDSDPATTVAVGSGSNDVALAIDGTLPYNIIWFNDNMMSTSAGVIIDAGSHALGNGEPTWRFMGSDPYAIKIKSSCEDKYITSAVSLDTEESNAQTFMLLKKEGYDYGILQVTGGNEKLTFGNHDSDEETPDTWYLNAGAPTKFIIFALSTGKLIYHLVIGNTGDPQYIAIPYREGVEGDNGTWTDNYRQIICTTQRNLTTHPIADVEYDHIGLGDVLEEPSTFKRPNCQYRFYIEGVYDSYTDDVTNTPSSINSNYKGLLVTKMGKSDDLLNKIVKVNVEYYFDTGLNTNSGTDFVTGVDQNLWYTFETTTSAKPWLAQYTNAWGFQTHEGRDSRFTNDYLWTPLGDPFGFRMYNRYMIRNSGLPNFQLTTLTDTPSNGDDIVMADPSEAAFTTDDSDASAYSAAAIDFQKEAASVEAMEAAAKELTKAGDYYYNIDSGSSYKKVTVTRSKNSNSFIFELLQGSQDGIFKVCPLEDETLFLDNSTETGSSDVREVTLKASTTSNWTFGLSKELLEPYVERKGYIGGLKEGVYKAHQTLFDNLVNGEATGADMMEVQGYVYKDEYLVPFDASGYFRLHNQPGVSDISPVRYASGYLHKTEQTESIPMHFYSRKNVSTTFGDDGLEKGYTVSAATRGPIPVPATEYDPSTLFQIQRVANVSAAVNKATMSTQGLYVKGVNVDDYHGDAVMTPTAGDATTFTFMDIGGAVFLIHNGAVPAERQYFNFDQTYEVGDVKMIYDLKFYHEVGTDDAKWCLEPASNQGLMVATNSGGDGYYYTTFCAPYDVLLPDDGEATNAYVCTVWDTEIIHPKKVGQYNTTGDYTGSNKFVPGGTPVIIRTTNNSGHIQLSLPTSTPTTPLSCVFSGKYLEQLLETSENKVYSFGLPITGYTFYESGDHLEGDINIASRTQNYTGVGFYINATPNKEASGVESGLWVPNNRYVLHNKIYYRSDGSGASARRRTPMPTFIPVVFDDELAEEGEEPGNEVLPFDGRVYDMQGRCVANRLAADDGTWKQRVAPGIYIVNGKKMLVGRR